MVGQVRSLWLSPLISITLITLNVIALISVLFRWRMLMVLLGVIRLFLLMRICFSPLRWMSSWFHLRAVMPL
ncbi:hypothetical protein D3C84_1263430 [compost metagenome]